MKRRVFYIPGFDPHPPRRYRELYRSESQKQARISGYQVEQKASALKDGYGWSVSLNDEGTQRSCHRNLGLVRHRKDLHVVGDCCNLLEFGKNSMDLHKIGYTL